MHVCVFSYVNNQLNYRQTRLDRRRPNLRLQCPNRYSGIQLYRVRPFVLIICGRQKTRSKRAIPRYTLRVRAVNGISVTSGRKCALINAVSIAMLHVLVRQETHGCNRGVTLHLQSIKMQSRNYS